MAATKRICPAGEVFHVLSRAVPRMTLLDKALVPLPIDALPLQFSLSRFSKIEQQFLNRHPA
jgi:hypothetical protein